jgi:hypothetical protein
MLRWHILRFRGWQLSLHKICRDDDDRALHDHRADNISLILNDGYFEVLRPKGATRDVWKFRWPLRPYFRKAEDLHRIVIPGYAPVWSLWLRWPPRREWGFMCPKGWRHWRDFCGEDYNAEGVSTVGKGCD